MLKRVNPEIPEGWWEIVIALFVIVSVFGAALLTQQDRPSLPSDWSDSAPAYVTRAPRLATPTPTKGPVYSSDTDTPSLILVTGTPSRSGGSSQDQLATPTPTSTAPPTVVGWPE